MEELSPSHAAAAACCCSTCRHQDGVLGGLPARKPHAHPGSPPPEGKDAAEARAPGRSHSARTNGQGGTVTMCQDGGSGWGSMVAGASSGCWGAHPAPLEHAPLPGRQGAIREIAGSCLR